MTPAEVKALALPEYLALAKYMDADLRERKRQAKARGKGKKR